MITSKQVDMAVQEAYNSFATGNFEGLDPRNYRDGYWALERLFREHVNLESRDTVLAGAIAVYGWMPRVFEELRDYRGITDTLRQLEEVQSCVDGYNIARTCSNRDALLRFVNGSVVGTSKFLHFLNPRSIPIWDSRVARNFGIKGHDKVNRVDRFMEYWAGLCSCQAVAPPAFVEFCRRTDMHHPTPLRLKEYALFLHAGRA